MNEPGQYLIHFTNRGPKVFASEDGSVGTFKVSTKQPLKDINKFGLLHYSVPKLLDCLDRNTASFELVLYYFDGSNITVPVEMPILDYYNMYVSQVHDRSIDGNGFQGKAKNILALDEVLQTTLNWAIMKKYSDLMANPANRTFCELLLGRVSCIVERNSEGLLEITCGYRGWNVVQNNQDYSQSMNAGFALNSGRPDEPWNCILPGGQEIYGAAAIANVGGLGLAAPDNDPVNGRLGTPIGPEILRNLAIQSFGFLNLSMRMQMILGVRGSDLVTSDPGLAPQAEKTRGRIRLSNFVTADGPTGSVRFTCSIPPNLDPPSFMYLQLQVPGTRSKVLGQADERGGWAIPTAPNEYISSYVNFPGNFDYHTHTVRYAPAVDTAQLYTALFANKPPNTAGVGFNFDYIPIGANTVIGNGVARIDNYHLGANPNIAKSRLLRIGRLTPNFSPILPLQRYHRHNSQAQSGQYGAGFGIGGYRKSAVFTVSLVEPNFVYTAVENATMQTFDVQLMWGDTSEPVDCTAGNPVQFSLIASP